MVVMMGASVVASNRRCEALGGPLWGKAVLCLMCTLVSWGTPHDQPRIQTHGYCVQLRLAVQL